MARVAQKRAEKLPSLSPFFFVFEKKKFFLTKKEEVGVFDEGCSFSASRD